MKIEAVESSYSRWAPVYDRTFGAVTNPGRKRAVKHINRREGTVLEVGVGTGLALPHYRPDLRVTGIDYSSMHTQRRPALPSKVVVASALLTFVNLSRMRFADTCGVLA